MFNFSRICPSESQSSAGLNSAAKSSPASLMVGIMVLMLLGLLATSAANGQVLYGSLTGNVADPKGAAVPGAKLDLVNVSTSAAKSTTSDERGGYSFSDLQAGVYKLTISLTGFKTSIKDDIKVEANKIYRFDPQLEVGEVKETVVISAATDVPLQTDRGDVRLHGGPNAAHRRNAGRPGRRQRAQRERFD